MVLTFFSRIPHHRGDIGRRPKPRPRLTLRLTGVAALTVDTDRAGPAALPRATIAVCTDSPARITLDRLPPGTRVRLDDTAAATAVAVPAGRHRITLMSPPHQRRPGAGDI